MDTRTIGHYRGHVNARYHHPVVEDQLARLRSLLESDAAERLSRGPDYVAKLTLEMPDEGLVPVAVKVFRKAPRLKDWYDRRIGSKAERSYRTAAFLLERGLATPDPIASLDHWDGRRLVESYYVCRFDASPSFRAVLAAIYHDVRDNEPLMDLLHVVAPAIRAMHDAGCRHGDLNNQNILLPRNEDGSWGQPAFIDLNRARISNRPLSPRERALDISRIILPGYYLRTFKSIYFDHDDVPAEFQVHDAINRAYIQLHRRTGKLRHPVRHLKTRHLKPAHPPYPPPRDLWLWDDKSAQPIASLSAVEKARQRSFATLLVAAAREVWLLPSIFREYRGVLRESFTAPLEMRGRIGVALHPRSDYIEPELALLERLGNPPALLRFGHHETPDDWQQGLGLAKRLHEVGTPFMVALLHDRRAVLDPASWRSFLELIIGTLADRALRFEVTHAFNRMKWGIWSTSELANLMQPAFELRERYPGVKLTGPATIDFEYHRLIQALSALPRGMRLDALSHLLYVDRRGAPENGQSGFSTLEKCALLKAIARVHPACGDEVIVSEVNWPIKDTGIWSPVSCGYLSTDRKRNPPGVTEDAYANYMLRYLAIALCSGHVEQVFWWRLSAHGYGLVDDRDGFRPRPAFLALEHFLQLLGNARFTRRLHPANGAYALEFEDRDRSIVMAWTNDREVDDVHDIPRSEALDREGRPLREVRLSGSPVYFVRPREA